MQDFFQLLQPGLQLLRPPKKEYEGPLLGGMVPFTTQTFKDEWDLEPTQVWQCARYVFHAALGHCMSQRLCIVECILPASMLAVALI